VEKESSLLHLPLMREVPYSEIEVMGRFSLQYAKEVRPIHLLGQFSWLEKEGEKTLAVFSPLGQELAKVTVVKEGSVFVERQGKKLYAGTQEEFTEHLVGLPLPIQYLGDWLQGCVRENKEPCQLAQSEHKVKGWVVRYASWQDLPFKQGMLNKYPKRIDIEGNDKQGQSIMLRFTIDTWQPGVQ
jgi:outer membrane biogenesis lipoprotein LolB